MTRLAFRFLLLAGGTLALASLTTDAAGSTQVNGGSVTTTGAQTYNDRVTLGAGATFTSTGAGQIQFVTTLDSAPLSNETLTLNTAGVTLHSPR